MKNLQQIIIKTGLLFSTLAVIYFVQRGLPWKDVLLKSVVIFFVVSILVSVIALIFIKSTNQNSFRENNNLHQNK